MATQRRSSSRPSSNTLGRANTIDCSQIRRNASTASTAVASADVIAQGRQVHADQCAACHGTDLEGQPDWRTPLASGRLPAPPHDESGHTWHHHDEVLFRIVKEGTAAVVGGG